MSGMVDGKGACVDAQAIELNEAKGVLQVPQAAPLHRNHLDFNLKSSLGGSMQLRAVLSSVRVNE